VPKDYEEACNFDDRNSNDKWTTATSLEIVQMDEYMTSSLIEENLMIARYLKGFKKIRVHLIFAVKHDGCHKVCLVADGHITDVALNSVGLYSGVVSLRGLRMCIFLAKLNGMEAHATDIGNVCLEATTDEKVCIRAGSNLVHWKDIYLSSTKPCMASEAVAYASANY